MRKGGCIGSLGEFKFSVLTTSLMARLFAMLIHVAAGSLSGLARRNCGQEVSMRRLSAAAVAVLLSCGAAAAQTMSITPTAPAMGSVSPLGIPGASGTM